jgi:DNA-binding MarR family transcriptional regulator
MTQRALSQALRCSPRNVTWLADALEGDGFITRGPHPTDRRATLISLTERGAAAAAAAHTDYQQGSARLFAGVPEADMKTFVAVLDLVLDRLRSGEMEDAGQQAPRTTTQQHRGSR